MLDIVLQRVRFYLVRNFFITMLGSVDKVLCYECINTIPPVLVNVRQLMREYSIFFTARIGQYIVFNYNQIAMGNSICRVVPVCSGK